MAVTVFLFSVFCISSCLFAWTRRERRLAGAALFFCGTGDEDMKIVGESFPAKPSIEDNAEAEARQFLRQKSAGNIDKARSLGVEYAKAILNMADKPFHGSEKEKTQQEIHHQLLLCSYIVNRVIAEHSPNSILAQTSLNVFYDEIEKESPALYQHVSDMAAFSLYILCERSDARDNGEIGKIYAKLCGMEGNQEAVDEGNQIYNRFYKLCVDMLDHTAYIPV